MALPRLCFNHLRPLTFSLGVSALTGILFGIVPAFQTSKLDVTSALKQGGRSGEGHRRTNARSLLLIGEVALSLMLLVGAGLLIKSFLRLQEVRPGFNAHNVLVAKLALQGPKYKDDQQFVEFFRQLEERLETVPGVQAAGGSVNLPLNASGYAIGRGFIPEGRPLTVDESAVRAGMAAARWAGRLEFFPSAAGGRGILLDGAHNPAGARALARALAELGVRRFPLVFGAMRGKRVAAILHALAPLDPLPVFTAVADPHAHRPEELLRTWRRVAPGSRGTSVGVLAASPAEALARAAALPGTGPVVVAGSLYLVGAVRGALTGEPEEA